MNGYPLETNEYTSLKRKLIYSVKIHLRVNDEQENFTHEY